MPSSSTTEKSDKNNNPTFKIVKQYFSPRKWKAYHFSGKPVLDLLYQDSSSEVKQQWGCAVVVDEDSFNGKIAFFSRIPFRASKDRTEEIAELLHRINYVEDIGNFELSETSYGTGQIRCKTCVGVVISENITPILLESIVRNNINLVKKYLPIIEQVNQGKLLPSEAIENKKDNTSNLEPTETQEQNEHQNTESKGLEQLQQELRSNKQKLTELRTQLKKVEERIDFARRTNIFGRPQSGENERERDKLTQEIKDTKNRIALDESAIKALEE